MLLDIKKIRKTDIIIIIALVIIAIFVLSEVNLFKTITEEDIPEITFIKDDEDNKLIVDYVSTAVKWSDLDVQGKCNTSGLINWVVKGDEITQCKDTITITYAPKNIVLGTWTFSTKEKLPESIVSSIERSISPVDEGKHYDDLLVSREWWYWSTVTDNNCELGGWTISMSFMHLARNDLPMASNPDVMVLTLNGPNGEKYGGMIDKKRGFGIFNNPTLDARTPGLNIKFEDSWAQGEFPEWRIHIEDKDIDTNYQIIVDLTFKTQSDPFWVYSGRLFDKGDSNVASYMFTGCDVTGTVKIDNAEYNIHGVGHHEHSWSSGVLKNVIKGWDWCHLTLDNDWNIYFSRYPILRQRSSSTEITVNPTTSVILTTNNGETLTILKETDITIRKSKQVFPILKPLIKTPTEIKIKAEPNVFTQALLNTYKIQLDIDIKAESLFEQKYTGLLNAVSMNIGSCSVEGQITWSDEDGDHDVDLNGVGSFWTMRH